MAKRDYGVEYTQLTVINWRTDVLPFYEKRGFVRVGVKPFAQRMCDEDILTREAHFIIMRRKAEE